MQAKNLPPSMSRNTVAEIKGSKYPDQVLVLYCTGHHCRISIVYSVFGSVTNTMPAYFMTFVYF